MSYYTEQTHIFGGFMSDIKVAKFGGSSLADAEQFQKVISIIKRDASIKYVVPSAPGKRFSGDTKVTDMLLSIYEKAQKGADCAKDLAEIKERYDSIIRELGLDFSLDEEFVKIGYLLKSRAGRDYVASRGEYLCGLVLANALGFEFVDASTIIRFKDDGSLDSELTNKLTADYLSAHENAVVPGFYGSMPNDTVKTFSRGGSDITGAIVARAADASLYENWTDVSGFMAADPRIVENPLTISYITYRELRELSYMGATVLHEDSIFPVSRAGIPINIRNTNRPDDAGTMIVEKIDKEQRNEMVVTGIAGRKNFAVVNIEKERMHFDVGFMARAFEVFNRYGVSIEHVPTGIDTMSVVVECNEKFLENEQAIYAKLVEKLSPDTISIDKNVALIAVVGRGMKSKPGTAAKVFSAVAKADISIIMIDQGSSELNIIIGVDKYNFENAIKAIYKEFADGAAK